ncbi:hypothetical protein LXL04_039129 [Taraxacum kok-saghyz]
MHNNMIVEAKGRSICMYDEMETLRSKIPRRVTHFEKTWRHMFTKTTTRHRVLDQLVLLRRMMLARQGRFHLGDATVVYQLHSPHRGATRILEEDTKEDCGFFEWYDDEVSEWYKEVLNQLKPKKKSLKSKGTGDREASVLNLVRFELAIVFQQQDPHHLVFSAITSTSSCLGLGVICSTSIGFSIKHLRTSASE